MRSSELRGFLTGFVLGDGHIGKGITKRSFHLKSINKDLIEYVYKELNGATNFKLSVKEIPASVRDGVSRKSYKELSIKAHPYFAKKYPFFYGDNGKRRITNEVLDWLTPQGIANWFMSDGYIVHTGKTKGKIVHRRVELCTDRYHEKDVDKVVKYFSEKHNLSVAKIKRKEGVFRVRFHLITAQDLFLMIAPYVVDSMKYKLNLVYDYKPDWMKQEYYDLMREITECENPY